MVVMVALVLGVACSFVDRGPTDGHEDWAQEVVVEDRGSVEYLYGDFLSGRSVLSLPSQAGIGEPVLLEIVDHPEVGPIEDVTVAEGQITARGVRGIMAGKNTSGLRSLHLTGNPLGEDGLRALAESPRLAQLKTLHIQDVGATAAGVQALAASPHFRVGSVVMGFQAIGDAGAEALAAATMVDSFRLESAEIGGRGAQALIEGTHAKRLDLTKNPIHLVGLRKISPHLLSLTLDETPLTAEDIQALAALPAPGLKSLSIAYVAMSDPVYEAILAAPWFDQLEQLMLGGPPDHSSPEVRARFVEAYGDHRWLGGL
jgi:hypothetical protein